LHLIYYDRRRAPPLLARHAIQVHGAKQPREILFVFRRQWFVGFEISAEGFDLALAGSVAQAEEPSIQPLTHILLCALRVIAVGVALALGWHRSPLSGGGASALQLHFPSAD